MDEINLFSLARERGWHWREILDLSVNVNPLGLAPGVRAAVDRTLDQMSHYPERVPLLLVEEFARKWGARPEQILPGNGATELIYFLARVWQREVTTLGVPARPEFHHAHPLAREVPWNEPSRWATSGLMALSQPNPFTGQMLPFDELRTWLGRTRNPVLIDESLIEYCDAPSAISLIGERENLFVLRSMSAFYGLAGFRLGGLVAEAGAVASLMAKREPWQINRLGMAAALEVLEDGDYAARTRDLIAEERGWMWEQLQRIPTITPVRTDAAWFLICLPSGAAELCRWFLERKVIVRNCTGTPGIEEDAVRIAVRKRSANERVIAMLKEYFCG